MEGAHSKHGFILVLLASAGALLVMLGAVLSTAFLKTGEPYLTGREFKQPKEVAEEDVPLFATKTEGNIMSVVQVGAAGAVLKTIYTSDTTDRNADFELLAVPQTHYTGKIYVQSVQDAEDVALIIYPLDVVTGKISAATVNTLRDSATLSPEQNRVAVISNSPERKISVYDIITGTNLASWTLAANERLTESAGYGRAYTGDGVRWTSNICFDHNVWVNSVMELRTFCTDAVN